MSRSRIFDEYEKLAVERGLIKTAEEYTESLPKETKEFTTREEMMKAKPKKDISAIEALYGLQPNGKEKHIMEQAHPEPVVIAPAYDRINGLVENEIERQKITINQIGRGNTGNLNYKKLATDEFMFQLVRVANDLDNKGDDELRELADACIESLAAGKVGSGPFDRRKNADPLDSRKVEDMLSERGDDLIETGKGVAGGAVIGGVIGGIAGGIFGLGAGAVPGAILGAKIGGVAGGLIAAIAKTSAEATNVGNDAIAAIDELNDIQKKFPENKFLQNLREQLNVLYDLADKYGQLSNNAEGKIQGPAEEVRQLTNNYLRQMDKIEQLSNSFFGLVNQGVFKDNSTWNKIKSPLYLFIDDDVEDEMDALKTLSRSIHNAKTTIMELRKQGTAAMQQIASNPAATTPQPTGQSAPQPAGQSASQSKAPNPSLQQLPSGADEDAEDDEIIWVREN